MLLLTLVVIRHRTAHDDNHLYERVRAGHNNGLD